MAEEDGTTLILTKSSWPTSSPPTSRCPCEPQAQGPQRGVNWRPIDTHCREGLGNVMNDDYFMCPANICKAQCFKLQITWILRGRNDYDSLLILLESLEKCLSSQALGLCEDSVSKQRNEMSFSTECMRREPTATATYELKMSSGKILIAILWCRKWNLNYCTIYEILNWMSFQTGWELAH